MPQNFSKMSDIYIPELMELDSYWQKAVEDAICDTLKGEKRLCLALRNRKKINEKLEHLGLKCGRSQLNLSVQSQRTLDTLEDRDVSESGSEPTTFLGLENESQGMLDRTRSGSGHKESKYKSPERPLLGDGSLEKITKSQNSFNFEPMEDEDKEEDLSESEKDEEMDYHVVPSQEKRIKNIEWLHVRGDTEFEESDHESDYNSPVDGSEFQESSKNYFVEEGPNHGLTEGISDGESSNVLSSNKGSLWGGPAKGHPGLERKLHLALAKRDILNKTLNASNFGSGSASIEIYQSAAKLTEKRKKGRKEMSPFIRFYLEVYRDLCHKCTVMQITEEAAKKWRNMTAKQKAEYEDLKHKK